MRLEISAEVELSIKTLDVISNIIRLLKDDKAVNIKAAFQGTVNVYD